jgi:hypothetical protein
MVREIGVGRSPFIFVLELQVHLEKDWMVSLSLDPSGSVFTF